MKLFDTLAESADLVSGMADRLDYSLSTGDPLGDAQTFSRLALKCAECTCHEDCKKLQAMTLRLEEPPAYCRNAETLRRLG